VFEWVQDVQDRRGVDSESSSVREWFAREWAGPGQGRLGDVGRWMLIEVGFVFCVLDRTLRYPPARVQEDRCARQQRRSSVRPRTSRGSVSVSTILVSLSFAVVYHR